MGLLSNLKLETKLEVTTLVLWCPQRPIDLVCTFHAKHLSLRECQSFITDGEARKKNQSTKQSEGSWIRKQLQIRGFNVEWKKPELHEQLENIQKGIANVPALLHNTPEATFDSLDLQSYEVFSSESLHDFKGHLIISLKNAW